MKLNAFQRMLGALACVGMILPQAVWAEVAGNSTHVHDIALRPGGILVGQVVTPEGMVLADKPIVIYQDQHEVVRTTTDELGVFAARGLRGGQYAIATDDSYGVYRFWASDTAPPVAQPTAVVVSGGDVVRGQWGYPSAQGWLQWMRAHPYLTAGVIASAIAIPLALADRDSRPSS